MFHNGNGGGAYFTFADGTRGYEDAAGNVVLVDNNGASAGTVPANGSAIVQQFVDLVSYGMRSAINAKYPQQAQQAHQQQQTSQFAGLLLLGLGAFLIFKLAT